MSYSKEHGKSLFIRLICLRSRELSCEAFTKEGSIEQFLQGK